MKNILILFFTLYFSHISGANIAVTSLVVGEKYAQTVSLARINKEQYCQLHGYDFICGHESLDQSRPIPWSKILLVLQVMEDPMEDSMEDPKYDWVFWTDADSLIMNPSIQLESLIDDEYNFIIAKDRLRLNSGQFLIKNNDWSRQFLRDVYSRTEFIYDRHWEETAIIAEYNAKKEVRDLTKIIPQRLINAYPWEISGKCITATYQPGDFIVHFLGLRASLESYLQRYAKQVLSNPAAQDAPKGL